MAKKKEELVEEVKDVKDLTSETEKVDNKDNKTKKELVELEVIFKGGFSDKYTKKDYKEGQHISVEESRAEELLSDKRKLVKKA